MNTNAPTRTTVRLAAVGDLLLAPGPEGVPYLRDLRLISARLRTLLAGCDVVFGNLECTLPGDGSHVPTEPRVVATEELVRAVRAAGFGVVTLANNHMFDCLDAGFRNLRGLLDEIGLPHFGAGMDLEEATRPAFLEIHGVRIAFLGAVDHRSGPHQFATPADWGVAPVDLERLTRQIRELHSQADHVIVSVHWGEERFLVPSPEQIDQARAMVDAGASIVLGHHPHVLQGVETWHGMPIAYSLGNFLADDVHFSDGDTMHWNRTERTGCVLLADLGPEGVCEIRQVPTFDSGQLVDLDDTGFGQRRIDRTRRAIARGVALGRYRREHLWVKTIVPILTHLRWSKLRRLRVHQLRNAVRRLLQAGQAR